MSSTCIEASCRPRGIWSDYLTGYINKNKLLLPVGMGRIYRVVYDGPNESRAQAAAVKSDAGAAGFDTLAPERLVA